MSETIVGTDERGPFELIPAMFQRFLKNRIAQGLGHIGWGSIRVQDSDGEFLLGATDNEGPHVTLSVHDRDFYSYAALGGSVGVGQSYFLGLWDVSNLTELVRIFARNRHALHALDSSWAKLGRYFHHAVHRRRENSLSGSKKNISAHYDLGNDFFELMLDPTMMYSSAVFSSEDESLEAAQRRKLDIICRKLKLEPGDRVVEIGTGWGGFAEYAASEYGVHVTTTTISREQYEFAQQRIADAGLADKVTLLFEDYRDLEGKFDKLVSIEMLEAVGYEYYDGYFAMVEKLLKPDGLALLQVITIEEQSYFRARDSADFIKRFIFPGGCLPSVGAISASLAKTSDLKLVHLEDIGAHYATTLNRWRESVHRNRDRLMETGYGDQFLRLWDYYLAYCEGGFIERSIADLHFLIARDRASINHLNLR